MDLQLGIDLGTTNSVAAYINNGRVEYVKFRNKESISSVLLSHDGKLLVGDKARKKAVLYPDNYVKSSKTYMGDSDMAWSIDGREFSPTDVASEILLEIRKVIEKTMTSVERISAVITVPAYFTSSRIDETKKAGEAAGFIVKQIITEPVAAAVAYGLDDNIDQKIFVIDVGGGTFDTAILEVKNTVFNTLAVGGDDSLGGDNFDEKLFQMFLKHIRREKGIDLSSAEKSLLDRESYTKAHHALVVKAEEAKIELSENQSIDVDVANLFDNYHFSVSINRQEFESAASLILAKIKMEIRDTLKESGLAASDIDKIVLVGGSARIPAIRDFVTQIFGKTPYSDKPLDKLVAMGAAIVATDSNGIVIRDIVSHSLGIEIVGEKFSSIIGKNSRYPISRSEIFTTTEDFQTAIKIQVYEGEDSNNVNNNTFYGGFKLKDIEQAKKHMPKIEVTFEFDKNRILHVTAKDMKTQSVQSRTLEISKSKN